MHLLRNQDPPVDGLAETLIAMIDRGKQHNIGGNNFKSSAHNSAREKEIAGGRPRDDQSCFPGCSSCFPSRHPPAVLDCCIQHLGAMLDELDEKGRLGPIDKVDATVGRLNAT